ncbi:mitochondrial ribonuclease P protein 1 homolog isoform X2 [Amblyomma americanum]
MAKLLPRFCVPLIRCASTRPAVAASGGQRLLSFFRPECKVRSQAPAFVRQFSRVSDAADPVDVGQEKDADAAECSPAVHSTEMTVDDFKELVTSDEAWATMFGQTLVFDLDYEHEMSKRELTNAADQLQEVYATNRLDPDPFNLVFCNVKEGSQYKQHLHRVLPHLGKPSCLVTATEKSYLDLYPKERLVYLTPDARQPLRYSDDAIYIVGAMVDLGSQRPLSMAKAKRQGISFARLPLDEYLQWGQSSSKTLALNHITRILLDMKATKDWSKAFESVPRRKLKTPEELEAEAQYRSSKEVQRKRVLKKFKLE